MKWYAYSVKGNVVNMILDHNINPSGTVVQWVSSVDYNNSATLGENLGVTNIGNGSYGSSGNHKKGPLTALSYSDVNGTHFGVRPVITVSSSTVFSN